MTIKNERLFETILAGFERYEPSRAFWDDVLLSIFRVHSETHPVYRRWLAGMGYHAEKIRSVEDIPPVPIDLFKSTWPGRFPAERAVRIFRSSGTTRGSAQRSQHPFYRMELYRINACQHFRHMVLPDRERIKMLMVAPTSEQRPDSSLGYMLTVLMETFGDDGSSAAWSEEGPDVDAVLRWHHGLAADEPVLVFGTALGLYRLMRALRERGIHGLPLPEGSRVLETGGFKGVRVTLDRDTFRSQLQVFFGKGALVLAEYGMCELGSQLYENTVRRALLHEAGPIRWVSPPWLRVMVWDPVRWRPVREPGRSGPIAFFDAANLDAFAFFVSEDRGRMAEGGLVLEGRLRGAEIRGCSLLAGV